MLAHEDVHQVLPTVGRCPKQFEEPSIVALGQSFPHIQCMLHWLTRFLLCIQMLQHSHNLALHLAEVKVEDFICKEFLRPYLITNTYNLVSLDPLAVQIVKLCLTLIKVVKIRELQGDPGMSLVDLKKARLRNAPSYFDCECILNPLDDKILPHRAKLVIEVHVVCFLIPPLLLH